MPLLDTQAYESCALTSETHVLIAVSGGADSTALLLELVRLWREKKLCRVAVAHVNHGIRGEEALRDENFVRELCQDLCVPFFVICVDAPAHAKQHGKSLEHAARDLRYAFLEQIAAEQGFDCIAVAHHREDQAETILQHAIRGCGLSGMIGMKPIRGNLVRPLLRVCKAEILDYLSRLGQAYITDSTNAEPCAQRNRLRQRVLPELLRENAKAVEHLCRTAEFFSEDEAYLAELASKAQAECGQDCKKLSQLPVPIRKRVLMSLLTGQGCAVSTDKIVRLDDLLLAQSGTTIPLSDGYCAWTEYNRLIIGKKPTWLAFDLPLKIGEECQTGQGKLSLSRSSQAALPAAPNEAYVDADRLCGELRVRNPKPGDIFSPFGLGGRKLLSDYLTDRKVPRYERVLPLFCDGVGIVYVAGHTIDERLRITAETKEILHIKYEKE